MALGPRFARPNLWLRLSGEVDRHPRLEVVGDGACGTVLGVVARAHVGIDRLEALEAGPAMARTGQHDLLGPDLDELETGLNGIDLAESVAIRLDQRGEH